MAQLWPRYDDWNREPTAFGTALAQWYSCLPSSFPDWVWGTLGRYGGDQPSSNAVESRTEPTSYLWREILPLNVGVESWTTQPQVAPLGTFGALAFKRVGVMARVSGGTYNTPSNYVANITGYMLDCVLNASVPANPRLSFTCYKYVAGTPTVLVNFTNVQLLNTPVDITKPIGLRLDVFSLSGTLNAIYGWLSNVNIGENTIENFNLFQAAGVPFGLFIDDVTATPALAAAGRGGVVLSPAQFDATFGIPTAPKVVFWQARNVTGIDGVTFLPTYGAVDVRDEFQRQTDVYTSNSLNVFGEAGPSVQSGWLGDSRSFINFLVYTGSLLASRIAAFGGGTSSVRLRMFISRRPADDPRRQTPRVRFLLNFGVGSGASNLEIGAGVIVHASANSPDLFAGNSNWRGYAAYCIYRPDLSPGIRWRFELWRYAGGGATAMLASGNGTWTAGSVGDVLVNVELEATPAGGTPTSDGPVRLLVRGGLAFADQTLTLAPGVPGIAADGAYIIDSSSDRITSGGEGMMFYGVNHSHRVEFLEWDQGALVNVETGINDLPSVSLDTEPTATESLNDYCKLILPLQSVDDWETLRPRAESGHVWARATDRKPRRTWRGCETFPMSKDDRDDFLTFWDAHATPGLAFDYTDEIKDATYTVRAVDSSLREERLFKDAHVFRFDMEELRDA